MTTDENTTYTVIEQAAKIIANHSEHGACMTAECNRDDRNAFWDRHIARALHDAGLLADPVDRDANTRVAARNALEWRMVARKNEDRAEHAEAEVAELRVTIDRVRALADEWEDEFGPGSEIERVMGKQSVTIKTAVELIRRALYGGGQ